MLETERYLAGDTAENYKELEKLLSKEGIRIVFKNTFPRLHEAELQFSNEISEIYFLVPIERDGRKIWCLFYKNRMGILEKIDISDVIDLSAELDDVIDIEKIEEEKKYKMLTQIANYHARNQQFLIANEMGRIQEETGYVGSYGMNGVAWTSDASVNQDIDQASDFILTIAASLMWIWMLYKIKPDKNNSYMESFIARNIQSNYYDKGTGQRFSEFRAKLNPWYRRFKTSAVLGYTVGQTIANFIPFFHTLPKPFSSIVQAIFGGVTGLIFGIFGSFFLPGDSLNSPVNLRIKKDFSPESTENKNEDEEGEGTQTTENTAKKTTKKGYVLSFNSGQHCWQLYVRVKAGAYKEIPLKDVRGLSEILSAYHSPEEIKEKDKLGMESLIHAYRNKHYTTFKLGGDGWTKYAKVGLVLGSSLGAAIGAAIGTFVFPGVGTALGAAIGSGVGGILGFIGFAVGVPLVNKVFPNDPHHKEKDHLGRDLGRYRTNYFRAGMTLGGGLGMVVGGIIGSIIPGAGTFPGAGTLLGALIGGAIGNLVGGIGLMKAGPRISAYVGEDRTQSTFDYDARTGAMFGNQFGVGLAVNAMLGVTTTLGSEKDAHGNHVDVKDMACGAGGFLAGTIALVYSLWYGYKHKDQPKNDYEKEKLILPWSQRVATSIVTGFAVGAIIGGIIGFCFGGPPGATLGVMIGGAAGGIAGGIIGTFWGEKIAQTFSGFATKFKKIVGMKCEERLEEKLSHQNQLNKMPLPQEASKESTQKVIHKLSANRDNNSINSPPSSIQTQSIKTTSEREWKGYFSYKFGCIFPPETQTSQDKVTEKHEAKVKPQPTQTESTNYNEYKAFRLCRGYGL